MTESSLCDAFLYRSDLGEKHRLVTFFNLASNAVTYGMAMGSARTGLGTDLPVGKSIAGPSLYYQALHAYSAFDWEFQQQLFERDLDAQPLPREIAILAGRFPKAFVDGFTDEDLAEVATAQRIACAIAPSLRPFAFRRLEKIDQSLSPAQGGVKYSTGIREKLWAGSIAKLNSIEDKACCTDDCDLEDKLASMASAYAPLCTVFAASFDDAQPDKSFTRLAIYLPALHTLHAEDVDDPSTWRLERGVPPIALPSPLQVSAACITEASYLRDADRTHHQGIALEVRRDFVDPQRVTMRVGFGRFFATDSDDLMGFDGGDHRDALHLVLHGNLPLEEGDGPRTRAAKESANRAMKVFSIEARVHQLTLHLNRDSGPENIEKLLRPQFSLEESKISFRIERRASSRTERLSLQAAGFEWEELPDGSGYLCWREFWTWDRLREFFGGGSSEGRGLGGMLITSREKLLGQAIGRATKMVLDHSIESIEQSLDDEIAKIVSAGLERYATARDVLAGRLHKGLF